MINRKEGFYWVKKYSEDNDNEWEIARWDYGMWEILGQRDEATDVAFSEINETPIKPPVGISFNKPSLLS